MRLFVGDRVQMRFSDDAPWRKGTVTVLIDGRSQVQEDGYYYAYTWKQVQPLVISRFHYLCPLYLSVSFYPFLVSIFHLVPSPFFKSLLLSFSLLSSLPINPALSEYINFSDLLSFHHFL